MYKEEPGHMRSEQNEQPWIIAAQQGDAQALEQLVEHFRRPLFAFILNMMPPFGDPEEIFQEVWLRVLKNFHRYRDKNFCGWLFRIARNCLIDRIRKEQRFLAPADPEGNDPVASYPDHRPDPGQAAGHAELGRRIRDALGELSPEQREVFLMRSEAGLSFREIARIQETSLNTALSRMHYALQKLRPLLIEDYHAHAMR
jgi:RNA polymerase sigma-70 factor (ECF subfamily)